MFSKTLGYLYFPDPDPGPGPNLYSTAPALNLYLPDAVLNFCLPVLRFSSKVCTRLFYRLQRLLLYLSIIFLMAN